MRHRAIVLFMGLLSLPLAIPAHARRDWPPPLLRDTGLYGDWNAKMVGPGIRPFSPQYPLWSDGAVKTRWMRLPPGTRIDASNPDVWKFPVGTRFWKEFRFSQRTETRFIEHTREGWRYATYEWTDDEREAVLVPDRGVMSRTVIRGTIRHAIPSTTDCRACHEGGPSRILGFSALQLSADRDANAPHAEALPPDAVTLRTLVALRLVRGLPRRFADGSPIIAGVTPVGRAALGYLHSNCGNCHTASGELGSLELSLNYPLATPPSQHPPGVLTMVGRTSKFVPSAWEGPAERVRAGDPDRSVLLARLASRNPVVQMPPLGSRLVDEQAVALIRKWIAEDPVIQRFRHVEGGGR